MTDLFSFPIIDPHIHQWDITGTPRTLTWPKRLLGWNPRLYEKAVRLGAKEDIRHYVGRFDYVAQDYLPDDYEQDRGDLPISHVMHVEAEWGRKKGLGPAEETAWLDTLFDHSAVKLGGIVGYVELQNPMFERLLQAHRDASKKWVGVRQMMAFDEDIGIMRFCPQAELSKNSNWLRGLEKIGELGIPYDAWFFHHQLPELAALAKSYPEMTFVLEHMGTPIGIGGRFASYGRNAEARDVILKTWQMNMAELAEYSNIHVKLSGLFMPVMGWGFEHRSAAPSMLELMENAAPLFEFVLQQFGVERCMFASNFPMDKVSLSLRQLYDFYFQLSSSFETAQQKALFHDNACRMYNVTL